MIVFVIMLRRRGLYGTDRIRRRKTVLKARFEPGVNLAIRLGGLARIGGMPVMRRGIELLSHEILRCGVNGGTPAKFPGVQTSSSQTAAEIPEPGSCGTGYAAGTPPAPRMLECLALRPPRSHGNQLAPACPTAGLKNIADNCFSNADASSDSSPSRAHSNASIGGSSGK
jgi:hypothetical protein